MNRVCIVKSTQSFVSYQSGERKPGTLITNAVRDGYDNDDLEELLTEDSAIVAMRTYESAEKQQKREEKETKANDVESARQVLCDKYKNKKKSDIIATDRAEWIDLLMAEQLDIDL